MQELNNLSRGITCAKALRLVLLGTFVKQQGEASVAGAEKVRGSVVGDREGMGRARSHRTLQAIVRTLL